MSSNQHGTETSRPPPRKKAARTLSQKLDDNWTALESSIVGIKRVEAQMEAAGAPGGNRGLLEGLMVKHGRQIVNRDRIGTARMWLLKEEEGGEGRKKKKEEKKKKGKKGGKGKGGGGVGRGEGGGEGGMWWEKEGGTGEGEGGARDELWWETSSA